MKATVVPEEVLTIPETAAELKISSKSVYRLIAAKRLKVIPVGTGSRPRARVTRASLEQFKARVIA